MTGDAEFSGPFDEVFRTEDVKIIKTPIRSPRANAFAERWVRTVREECPDHVLAFGRRHLLAILREYVAHYNTGRPHRSLALVPLEGPLEARASPVSSKVGRMSRERGHPTVPSEFSTPTGDPPDSAGPFTTRVAVLAQPEGDG